jgi:pimeloyl-ACP methyl ester carboxylesterase
MGIVAPPPRVEGKVTLADGRCIGFAEYGAPDGRPVLWFHGTPGARRQIPVAAREAAQLHGVRLISLERPGVGSSTPYLYEAVLGWTADVDECTDRLGVDRFGLVGLSGGGPYALACAYHSPDRVVSGAVLGSVAPTRGDDAVPGGLVDLAARAAPLLVALHQPFGQALWAAVRLARPVASPAFELYLRTAPAGDRRVCRTPGMKDMFIDDLLRGSRRWFTAPLLDLVLFGREWGFPLGRVEVPVHLWHGDSDNIVPLAHGRHLATRLPRADLRIRATEGHLGSLDAASEVLETLLADW